MSTNTTSNAIPRVREYMTPSPHTIGVEQPLAMASEKMRECHLRHLPVLRAGRLVGLLSERDLALIEALEGVDSERVSVEEAMTQSPWSVGPERPLDEVVAEMAERRYGAVVVESEGRVVGILTTVDVCRVLALVLRASAAR